MTYRLAAILLSATLTAPTALSAPYESDYRDRLCAGMRTEVVLPNGTRVDCLGHEFAIEVEFSNKWAEAIGQSLSYAAATGKRPGILLVCRPKMPEEKCLSHEYLIREVAARWRLPLTIWSCPATAMKLKDCSRRDLDIEG